MMKFLLLAMLGASLAMSEEWPQFRGPDGQGVVEAKNVPVEFGPGKNVVWETEVPGEGWSSPVMKDGLIILTSALKKEPVELQVMAFDAETGKPVWKKTVFKPTEKEAGSIHQKNSLASSTALIDGEIVYAHFGHMGTAALALKTGEVKWTFHETYNAMHGNGGCPILVDGVLIFSADGVDEGLLRGLNAETGKLKWEVNRNLDVTRKFSFGTPLEVEVGGEKIVVSQGSGIIGGYRPADGELLWWVNSGKGFSVVPRPLARDGMAYVATGFMVPKLLAIKLEGAKGDVTKTHVKWESKKDIPKTPSYVLSGDEFYLVEDTGRVSCVDRETGERVWRDQLLRKVSASVTLVGDRLYTFSEEGQAFVHQVNREGMKELAVSEFGEAIFASPIAFDGTLIVRSKSKLWRFGKK